MGTLTAVLRWPVSSQTRACRNALYATSALAFARAEREEAEAFIEQTRQARIPGPRSAREPRRVSES